jgi:hypothetical protein
VNNNEITDKAEALYNFWSQFGIKAYPSVMVPNEALKDLINIGTPYLTYDIVLGEFEDNCYMTGQIYYNVLKQGINPLVREQEYITNALKRGGMTIRYSDGLMRVNLASPGAQIINTEKDAIKKCVINIVVEYME